MERFISKTKFDSLKTSKETLYPWLVEVITEFGLEPVTVDKITNCKIYETYTDIVLASINPDTEKEEVIQFKFWFD